MPKKLTIEECHKIANEKGGECLENVYIDTTTKMRWRCKEGHTFNAPFGHVKYRGDWCVECSDNCTKKLTIEECHKVAKERGGECLDDKYINGRAEMNWKCGCGYTWKSQFRRIKEGSWCRICKNKQAGIRRIKLSLDDCHKLAEERGGKCLSTEYNYKIKMKWECKEGHIWKAIFAHIRNRGSWCPNCSYSKTEKLCRKIIEELTNKKFPSVRPDFLRNDKTGRNLELDGYNEELQMAFEYNGIQHYKYCPDFFHKKGEIEFIEQQKNDKLKIETCNKLGIKVLVIPYQYNYQDEDKLRLFIKSLI